MKRILVAAAALAAATSAIAKEKPKEAPPAPAYENGDDRMGGAMTEACAASPMTTDTYDGLDNMLIIDTSNGGHAFLHLSGCDFNTLLFADSMTPPESGCIKAGDAITVIGSDGGKRECKVTAINEWHPENNEIPDDQDGNN
ncbi:MAG: hypothetical protein GC153_09210 [Alphaproteobacteria bacterium]|nr:hypothetical protein [Alphaproteobacteria bacterium]